jgi:hypothetical protein
MDWCAPELSIDSDDNTKYLLSVKTILIYREKPNYKKYIINTSTGQVIFKDEVVIQDLKFDSLEDWEDSIIKIHAYLISEEVNYTDGSLSAQGPSQIEVVLRGGEKIEYIGSIISIVLSDYPKDLESLKKLILLVFNPSPSLSDSINDLVTSGNLFSPSANLRLAAELGFLIPTESTLSMMNLRDYGFFDD